MQKHTHNAGQYLKLSKHYNAFAFLSYDTHGIDDKYWFCPAKFELIDRVTHDELLSDEEYQGCIPVKQLKRAAVQKAFLEQPVYKNQRAELENAAAGDAELLEREFWNIVEADYALEEAYVRFESDYVLAYAEHWCLENQIPFVETEDTVAMPSHPWMFIDEVENILSYLKAGWTAEGYLELIRQVNPGAEDFSALTPAIEAAEERMREISQQQNL